MPNREIAVAAPQSEKGQIERAVKTALPDHAWAIVEDWDNEPLGDHVHVNVTMRRDADGVESVAREAIEALGFKTYSDSEVDALYDAMSA
ncbi:MAG: hypothetical protein QM658_03140 [Gordonia sp. (in: high G+C Gram-positive bacteria)]